MNYEMKSLSVIKAIRKYQIELLLTGVTCDVLFAGLRPFWHAGFHYSLWMWLQSPTADGGEGGGGEEQIPTAFHHHLYSCQWPKTPPHYCAANSSSSLLENESRSNRCQQKLLWNCRNHWEKVSAIAFYKSVFQQLFLLVGVINDEVSQFSGWGLQQYTHGTRLPHSVCSPIYENALSPDSWEAPACWSILLSCQGLVCEKGRCVQIWPLVTAGWPVQHTGLLTSTHIVHSAVVVEMFSHLAQRPYW